MTRKQRSLLLIAAAVVGVSSSVWAEVVYVKLRSGTLRSEKDASTAPVAGVKQGDKLQVIGREGSWIKVSIGGKQGYIQQNSISTEPVGGRGGTLSQSVASLSGSEAGAGLAGRGLGDDAKKWSQGKGLNNSGLERMLVQNEVIRHESGDIVNQFAKTGNLGRFKK